MSNHESDHRDERSGRSRNRGASEVVGFILIFGITISVIIFTAGVGIAQLTEVSESEPRRIATSELKQLRGNLYDHTQDAPYRSTALTGGGATIHYGDPIKITVSGTSPHGNLAPQEYFIRPVVYDIGRSQVVTAGGLISLQDDTGGVALKAGPRVQIAPERSQIPILKTVQTGETEAVSPASSSSIYMVSHRWSASATRYAPTDGSGNRVLATITITVETPRYEAWERYFSEHPEISSVSTNPSTNTVTAEFETKQLIVQENEIRLRIDTT